MSKGIFYLSKDGAREKYAMVKFKGRAQVFHCCHQSCREWQQKMLQVDMKSNHQLNGLSIFSEFCPFCKTIFCLHFSLAAREREAIFARKFIFF